MTPVLLNPNRGTRTFCALLLSLLAAACQRSQTPASSAPELTLLGGSELKDLSFLQPQMEAAAGVRIRLDYAGPTEMVDRVRAGGIDLAWPADGLYLRMNSSQPILAATPIMRSPVVLGLKKSRADELGWTRRAPSWQEIGRAVQRDQLALGMASPIASDLGLAALLSVALATADPAHPGPEAPEAAADRGRPGGEAIEGSMRSAPAVFDPARLAPLYAGMKLVGGSGSWLADAYAKQEDRLDGMVNYESAVLKLDAGDDLDTPLAVIHPRDGSLAAEYPLLLLNPARRPEYARLVAFLRSAEIQRQIVARTWHRPVIKGIPLPAAFGSAPFKTLRATPRPSQVSALLDLYQSRLRPPSHCYFVLDVSGSMAQAHRLDELKRALRLLAGRSEGGGLSDRYLRFQPREKVDVTTFSSHLVDHLSLELGTGSAYDAGLQRFVDFVDGLQPQGGTAIYDALRAVYQQALKDRHQTPSDYYTIVLMTDGENGSGMSFDGFRQWYEALPDTAQDIPVFAILFGDADRRQMDDLAQLTGGRVFDATRYGLGAVFKEIRGYQ
jgi:Ca-activated chloride channel family protein